MFIRKNKERTVKMYKIKDFKHSMEPLFNEMKEMYLMPIKKG